MGTTVTAAEEWEDKCSDTLEMLKDRMHAEIGDAKMYLEAAKAMQCKKDASAEIIVEGFYEMAKDEYTHAKFMYMYMVENGIEISQECRHNLKALEEEIEATFR